MTLHWARSLQASVHSYFRIPVHAWMLSTQVVRGLTFGRLFSILPSRVCLRGSPWSLIWYLSVVFLIVRSRRFSVFKPSKTFLCVILSLQLDLCHPFPWQPHFKAFCCIFHTFCQFPSFSLSSIAKHREDVKGVQLFGTKYCRKHAEFVFRRSYSSFKFFFLSCPGRIVNTDTWYHLTSFKILVNQCHIWSGVIVTVDFGNCLIQSWRPFTVVVSKSGPLYLVGRDGGMTLTEI